ncbi:MAG TPA: peptidylprolyl isomerase [Alphaproteobacteria bacterium]|nr:peptidylprolyl isomerase [Alphaproteobacteria bacterium]
MTDLRPILLRTAICTALASFALIAPPVPTFAAEPEETIVAVVNDEAISEGDLNARVKLAMLAGNYPDTPEVRDKIQAQVLKSLIDDQLRIQEARRLKLSVDRDEVENELKATAEQNHQTLAQLKELLAKQGVPFGALEKQTLAQVSWRKVIQKEIRKRIEVTDAEIDTAYSKLMSSVDKKQYLVAEIFLPVDSPAEDSRVRTFADNLETQIREGGNFAKLAQQFSQAAGASEGGDLGAVQDGELPEELDQKLKTMNPGEVSEPIRTQSGYHILLLRAKGNALEGDPNEAVVHLKNVLIPFTHQPKKEDLPQLVADAQKVGESLPNCAAIDAKGKRDGLGGDVGPPGQMTKVAALPRGIAAVVANLQVNQMSQPVPTNDGMMLFMVCARKDPPARKPPTRDQVANQLYLQRLDMQQQRYLSDLRASGFVDVRV